MKSLEFLEEVNMDNFVQSGIFKMENCKKSTSLEPDLVKKKT